MAKNNRSKKKTKAKVKVKVADQVILTEDSPVLEIPATEVADEVSKEAVVKSESDGGAEPSSKAKGVTKTPSEPSSDCDTESQGEKKSKREVEAEARENSASKPKEDTVFKEGMKKYKKFKTKLNKSEKENVEKERQNESSEDTSSVPDNLEDTSTAEDSNSTVAPVKDSSEAPTTDKVEPSKTVKTSAEKILEASGEVPPFVHDFVKRGWIQDHGKIKRDDGVEIEIHGCLGFDKDGRPIRVPTRDVEKPSGKGLDKFARDAVASQYNAEINEACLARAKTLVEMYKEFATRIPRLLPSVLKKVHVWNGRKDKDLNLVGILVGVQGGREGWTVKIDVTDKDGNVKTVRRGFRNFSTTLPVGVDQVSLIPLREAKDVEREADKKLLVDKRTNPVLPEGYTVALENLQKKDQRFHTILVWNSGGQQLSFFASPVEDEVDKFQWVSLDQSMGGHLKIHNNVIAMKGSIEELIVTTAKVNQDQIDDLLLVSIPEEDYGQLAVFFNTIGLCAVNEDVTDGKGQKQ